MSDTPRQGFYRAKMVRGGPWVPVCIWYGAPHDPDTGELLDRSPRWQCLRNGEMIDVYRVWPYCAGDVIDEAEYEYLIAAANWAKTYEPSAPEATPQKKIDWNKLPASF